jgi:2,3-bisphosphoglycerate-dependent phosphoglycerate mutase
MATDINKLKQAALSSLENPGQGQEMPKTQETKKPILYLFRHTQTTDNINRVFSGCKRNPKLTKEGEKQAKELAEKLKDKEIDLFISPPLLRCEQTLTPLREYLPDVPYLQKKELVERDYGDLTGKNKLEVMKMNPEKAILWRRSWDTAPPNGESIKQVWEGRIKQFCLWLEKKMQTEKINVAYSGTNNTVRLIRMYFEKLSIEQMLTIENPYADYASYQTSPRG